MPAVESTKVQIWASLCCKYITFVMESVVPPQHELQTQHPVGYPPRSLTRRGFRPALRAPQWTGDPLGVGQGDRQTHYPPVSPTDSAWYEWMPRHIMLAFPSFIVGCSNTVVKKTYKNTLLSICLCWESVATPIFNLSTLIKGWRVFYKETKAKNMSFVQHTRSQDVRGCCLGYKGYGI